jgi:hypothetical protein
MALLPATLEVSFDEPAFNLSELVQPTPSSGPHRFQIILVVRGDSLAEISLHLNSVYLVALWTKPQDAEKYCIL